MTASTARPTLQAAQLGPILASLSEGNARTAAIFRGDSPDRQPVHTVYGGAQIWKPDRAVQLGRTALRAMDLYAPDGATLGRALGLEPAFAERLHGRIREKLAREAVEDFRIDFEDGYGQRTEAEEDGHAVSTARDVAEGQRAGTLPPFLGIRLKPFNEELKARSVRTLDLFLSTLVRECGGQVPRPFYITLPKITSLEQPTALADLLDLLEEGLGVPRGTFEVELMIETTQSIFSPDGRVPLLEMVRALRGRCRGAHFGTYDYTAGCSVTAANQDMLHDSCHFARHVMQVALAGTGVWISDGATNILPVAPHAGEGLTPAQVAENVETVHRAWRLHFDHCTSSLVHAYYQGWDLHPAHLVTRYAAVYAFFLRSLDSAGERLSNFVGKAARATLVGDVFDDAATGQGLLNFFLRAVNCGAVTEEEALAATGLTMEELRSRSFTAILAGRTH